MLDSEDGTSHQFLSHTGHMSSAHKPHRACGYCKGQYKWEHFQEVLLASDVLEFCSTIEPLWHSGKNTAPVTWVRSGGTLTLVPNWWQLTYHHALSRAFTLSCHLDYLLSSHASCLVKSRGPLLFTVNSQNSFLLGANTCPLGVGKWQGTVH